MTEATAAVMGPPVSGDGAGASAGTGSGASVEQVTQQFAQMPSPRPRPEVADETEVQRLTRELEQVRTRRRDRDERREGEEVRSTTSSTQQRREAGSQPAIRQRTAAQMPSTDAELQAVHMALKNWCEEKRPDLEENFGKCPLFWQRLRTWIYFPEVWRVYARTLPPQHAHGSD